MNQPVISAKQAASYSQTLANELAKDTYNQAVTGINMGFTLAAAMAWNESIKKFIKTNVSERIGTSYQFVYALIVTMLAGFVFTMTRRYAQPSLKRSEITPMVGIYR
jgi:hypothetical protein